MIFASIPLFVIDAGIFSVMKISMPVFVIALVSLLNAKSLLTGKLDVISVIFFSYHISLLLLMILGQGVHLYIVSQFMVLLLWWFAIRSLAPLILDDLNNFLIFIRRSLVTILVVLIVMSVFFSFLLGNTEYLYREDRFTLIFSNPLYFGGVLYTVFFCACALYITSESRAKKMVFFSVALIAILAMFSAQARTFFLGALITIAAYLCYPFLRRFTPATFFPSVLLSGVFLASVASLVTNLLGFDINQVSSGRLLIWTNYIIENFDVWSVLFGGELAPQYVSVYSLENDASQAFQLQRLNVDNVYISFVSKFGLLGLVLLITAFVTTLLRLHLIGRSEDAMLARLAWFMSGALCAVMVMGLFYEFMPSLGNVLVAVVFPAIFAFAMLGKSALKCS